MSEEREPQAGGDPHPETAAVQAIRERFGDQVLAAEVNRGQWRLDVEREALRDVVGLVKDDPHGFDFLVDVTALDHFGEEPRFRAVYVLRSMKLREELVLKVHVPENDIWAPTLSDIFPTANRHEREAYDMFGIEFRDHPDLRRIMMPDMYPHFPLRKDFPMEGIMTDQEWAEWIIGRAQRLEADD